MVPGEVEIAVPAPTPTRLRLLRSMPTGATSDQHARWEYTLSVFRDALENYARAVQIRRQRLGLPRPKNHHVPVIGVDMSAEPVSQAEPRMCEQLVLTRREWQVAGLIAQGFSNQQIAAALVIEQGTVANHVAHILRKLDVANRTQIAAWFIANGSPATEATSLPLR